MFVPVTFSNSSKFCTRLMALRVTSEHRQLARACLVLPAKQPSKYGMTALSSTPVVA